MTHTTYMVEIRQDHLPGWYHIQVQRWSDAAQAYCDLSGPAWSRYCNTFGQATWHQENLINRHVSAAGNVTPSALNQARTQGYAV